MGRLPASSTLLASDVSWALPGRLVWTYSGLSPLWPFSGLRFSGSPPLTGKGSMAAWREGMAYGLSGVLLKVAMVGSIVDVEEACLYRKGNRR